MENLINITDKLQIRNLENKVFRLQNEIEVHLKTINRLQTENFQLIAESCRHREENQELKKLLKELGAKVVYG